MLAVNIGEFKYNMSYYLKLLQEGQTIALTYGKKKEPIAKIYPWRGKKKKLGLLEGKAEFEIAKDFKISDEEFLNS